MIDDQEGALRQEYDREALRCAAERTGGFGTFERCVPLSVDVEAEFLSDPEAFNSRVADMAFALRPVARTDAKVALARVRELCSTRIEKSLDSLENAFDVGLVYMARQVLDLLAKEE